MKQTIEIQQQQIFKTLLISQGILQRKTVINICEEINNFNQKSNRVFITPKALSKNQEFNLKINLILKPKKHPKLNKIQQSWIVCLFNEYSDQGIINNKLGTFIWQDDSKNDMRVEYNKNIFIIKSLAEGLNMMCMTQAEYLKRQKLQKMLRKSQVKYENNKKLFETKLLIEKYMNFSFKKQIRQITNLLQYYGKWRLRKLRRYFNQWAIYNYSKLIQKRETQIIQGNYILKYTNKRILQLVFKNWKSQTFSNKFSKF